jgi:amidase
LLGHFVHDDCKAALTDAVSLLESLGHHVVEAEPPADRDRFNRAFLTMVCGEVHADLMDAAQAIGRTATPGDVEYTTWALNLLGGAISAGEFVHAEHYLRSSARRLGEFFESFDLLLTPTLSVPPFPTGSLQPSAHERALIKILGRSQDAWSPREVSGKSFRRDSMGTALQRKRTAGYVGSALLERGESADRSTLRRTLWR